jgi:hypothetical protein
VAVKDEKQKKTANILPMDKNVQDSEITKFLEESSEVTGTEPCKNQQEIKV